MLEPNSSSRALKTVPLLDVVHSCSLFHSGVESQQIPADCVTLEGVPVDPNAVFHLDSGKHSHPCDGPLR